MKNRTAHLTTRLGILLLISAAASVLVFVCLRFGGGLLLERHLCGSGFQQKCNERRIQDFASYVEKNSLTVADTEAITQWIKKQPLILMEVYRFNILRYSSFAPEELTGNEEEAPHYDWVSYYEISFADGAADVVMYSDDTYRFFAGLTFVSLGFALLVFLSVFLRGIRTLVKYICQLNQEIQAMEGGDLNVPFTVQGNDELTQLAQSLDSMRRAFKAQKEEEAKIFHSNQAMITAMSHDLRTPLTTLQIYVDILLYKKHDPSKWDDYLRMIDAKAAQIKQLSENIFEYSLAFRSEEIVMESPRLFRDIFHDQLSEMVGYLSHKGFRFELALDWPDMTISVNSQYVRRIMSNIISNLEKYADPVRLIRVVSRSDGSAGLLLFQNKILNEAPQQEGTRIGLSNMKVMMEKMGGACRIDRTAELFTVELRFPAAGDSTSR